MHQPHPHAVVPLPSRQGSALASRRGLAALAVSGMMLAVPMACEGARERGPSADQSAPTADDGPTMSQRELTRDDDVLLASAAPYTAPFHRADSPETLDETAALDIRDAALIPDGTAPASAEAFVGLPRGRADARPVGGIGPGGLHLDDLVVGKDWRNSRCNAPSRVFSAGEDRRVSVCMRVVHQRIEESVTVVWTREGASPRRTVVHIPATHAYRTRAWLPAKTHFAGTWTVRVLAEDGTLLGHESFEITA